MTLFETFKEWITSTKYNTLLEDNKLLDLQMRANKTRMMEYQSKIKLLEKENFEKHNLLYDTLKLRDDLRVQFNKSQENHAGYKYYKAKYLLCHNELHDLKKKLSHLEDIATETEHLSKMLNDAQLEIRDLKNNPFYLLWEFQNIDHEFKNKPFKIASSDNNIVYEIGDSTITLELKLIQQTVDLEKKKLKPIIK